MNADFSVEMGRDDPVLDFPWKDPAGRLAYVDLRRHPELLPLIEEVANFPELGEFLLSANSERSALETAKCDAWTTDELRAEEEVYDASHKVASYVDAVFSIGAKSSSLPRSLSPSPFPALLPAVSKHEQFARRLAALLGRMPEIPAVVEVCIRRCYFEESGATREGCYFTLYVTGYGNGIADARQNWGAGLGLVAKALLRLSTTETW